MAILFKENFENGNLGGFFKTSGIPPTVTSEILARVGTRCMKAHLEAGEKRAEVSLSKIQNAIIGNKYWYGWSTFLPEPFLVNSAWEWVAQWHGRPDFDIGEVFAGQGAVLALATAHPLSNTTAEWVLRVHWDSKRNSSW